MLSQLGGALAKWYYEGQDLDRLTSAWNESMTNGSLGLGHPCGVGAALCVISLSSERGEWAMSESCRHWLAESFLSLYGRHSFEYHQAIHLLEMPYADFHGLRGLYSVEGLPGTGKTAALMAECSRRRVSPEPMHMYDYKTPPSPEEFVSCESLRAPIDGALAESTVLRQLAYGYAVAVVKGTSVVLEQSLQTARLLCLRHQLPLAESVILLDCDEETRRGRIAGRVSHEGVLETGDEWNDPDFRLAWMEGLVRIADHLQIPVHVCASIDRISQVMSDDHSSVPDASSRKSAFLSLTTQVLEARRN